MDSQHCIVGVHITDRVKNAGEVQKVLTDFGCSIKTRIGLHDAREDYCSPSGLVVLEVLGGDKVCNDMRRRLSAIEGVAVQVMVFEH